MLIVCARILPRLPKLATLEFDRNRKSMSVIVKGPAGNHLLVKGAAECVLERCTSIMLSGGAIKPLLPAMRASLLAAVDRMAEEALRCLVLAQKVLILYSFMTSLHIQNPLKSAASIPQDLFS